MSLQKIYRAYGMGNRGGERVPTAMGTTAPNDGKTNNGDCVHSSKRDLPSGNGRNASMLLLVIV
jgi:hypothetical protein